MPALALLAAAGLLASAPAAAKKKNLDRTIPGGPIANEVGDTDASTLFTTNAGKKFKGRRIRDVNVALQLTGVDLGSDGVDGLKIQLIAPSGKAVLLSESNFGGDVAGPVTFDDEAQFQFLGFGAPPLSPDPLALYRPYQGSVVPQSNKTLSIMDDGKARGTWTLRIRDDSDENTATLVDWRLQVRTGKPYDTK